MDTSNVFLSPLLRVISNSMLGSRTLDRTLEDKNHAFKQVKTY
jgi:hypothetical protein